MTSEAYRIAEVDVLRGAAVLGILAVNIGVTAQPIYLAAEPSLTGPVAPWDVAAWLAVEILFTGKFVTIFSVLFGASLLLVGGEGDEPGPNAVLRRRLGWLLVFGLVHGALIWWGDILLSYALWGFLAMRMRHRSPRWLLIVGLSLMAVTGGLELIDTMISSPADDPTAAELAERLERFRGDLAQTQAANLGSWSVGFWGSLFTYGFVTTGLMLVGMALLKAGVLQGRRSGGFYGWCIAAGLLATVAVAVPNLQCALSGFQDDAAYDRAWVINTFAAPVVALGYLGVVVLVGWRQGAAARWLAPVGRMAFSNYIGQSLVMTGLFWGGRGLGLYGRLDEAALLGVVVCVWAAQLILSRLWLTGFHYGPLEWVWRRLSSGQPTPFLR